MSSKPKDHTKTIATMKSVIADLKKNVNKITKEKEKAGAEKEQEVSPEEHKAALDHFASQYKMAKVNKDEAAASEHAKAYHAYAAKLTNHYHSKLKEDVEQVDEISKELANRYMHSAFSDRKRTDDKMFTLRDRQDTLGHNNRNKITKLLKKSDKRTTGISRALQRITNEEQSIMEVGQNFRRGNALRAAINAMSPEERKAYEEKRAEQQRKRDEARLARERLRNTKEEIEICNQCKADPCICDESHGFVNEDWVQTGKTATHMATGKKTFEWAKVNKEGKRTGERHYRTADGKILGEEMSEDHKKYYNKVAVKHLKDLMAKDSTPANKDYAKKMNKRALEAAKMSDPIAAKKHYTGVSEGKMGEKAAGDLDFHPEIKKTIKKLRPGMKTTFKDETGRQIHAHREGDNVHLTHHNTGSSTATKTTVGYHHFDESTEVQELNVMTLSKYAAKARAQSMDKNNPKKEKRAAGAANAYGKIHRGDYSEETNPYKLHEIKMSDDEYATKVKDYGKRAANLLKHSWSQHDVSKEKSKAGDKPGAEKALKTSSRAHKLFLKAQEKHLSKPANREAHIKKIMSGANEYYRSKKPGEYTGD